MTVKHRIVRKKPPVKKAAATATKKVAARKSTGPAKKAAPRKAVAKKSTGTTRVAKKSTAKKAATKRTAPTFTKNVFGFIEGSDQAIIVETMVEGGADRIDVAHKALDRLSSKTTRGGAEKNVPSLISGLLPKLEAAGYKVESSWALIPPANIRRKLAK